MRNYLTISSFLVYILLMFGAASAAINEPGGTPEAANLALTNPDEYAWQLFFHVNHQAKPGVAGIADEIKASLRNYDDRDVVWETWALSSGLDIGGTPLKIIVNKSEVFKNPATQPVAWENLNRTGPQPKVLSPNLKTLALTLSNLASTPSRNFHVLIAPPGTSPADDESRMNKSTYETVRSQRLYSVEGLEAAIARASKVGATSLVKFDQMSKEVKARWKHLTACDTDPQCQDKKRFHWRTVEVAGKKEIWGLVSLHVITKDLPNWFWADFGHIDCEKQAGACADESESAQTPPRDTTTRGSNGSPAPSGKDGVRKETEGSKWQNYILRGTQVDFTTPSGLDNILSNPVIESGFQLSSCITCHSYASAGLASAVPNNGTSLPILTGNKGVRNAGSQSLDIGKPKCQRFYTPKGGTTGNCPSVFDSVNPLYFQTDFLWSIPFRAFSETP